MDIYDTRRPTHSRLASFFLCFSLFFFALDHAIAAEGIVTNPPLTNAVLSDQAVTLRTGAGYKDNVLLSHFAPQGSGFSRVGLDADYLHTFADDSRLFLFGSGDDWYYWSHPSTHHEDLWTAIVDLKKDLGDDFVFETSAFYGFENQVLDLSTEENIPAAPAKVVGHTISLRPSLRWNFTTNYWTRFKWDTTRQFYSAPANSFTRLGPELSFGRDYGNKSEWAATYKFSWQRYDHERIIAIGPPVLAGARDDFRQRIEFRDSHYWDAAQHWQDTVQLFFEYNHDSSGGSFDFYHYGGAVELRYDDGRWEGGIRVEPGRYDYLHLAADTADPAKWYLSDVVVDIDLRRTVTEWLKIFVEYEYEHSFSNRITEDYQANTVSAGLEWIF